MPSRTVFYRNPEDTYVFVTRSALLERIRYAVAGLVAQDIMLGEGHTTYGEWDLVVCTPLPAPLSPPATIMQPPPPPPPPLSSFPLPPEAALEGRKYGMGTMLVSGADQFSSEDGTSVCGWGRLIHYAWL